MTLNVSLRVPDGIVIASDSLATVAQSFNQKVNVKGTCEKCGQETELKDVQTPPVSLPASTWPYAQKLFPFSNGSGAATYGWGFVNTRSIYSHIVELTSKLARNNDETPSDFDSLAKVFGDYFHDQLKSQLAKTGFPLELQPDNWWPFGFQFVGFSKDANQEPIAKTKLIKIGKTVDIENYEGIGCTCSGDFSVVQKLWPGGDTGARFEVFSLQDAIDYAKFLIRTTADYQRFSGNLPTVGGDIDIALVTNYRGFRWINQKPLYQILERKDEIS
jgi:hypothetical protein